MNNKGSQGTRKGLCCPLSGRQRFLRPGGIRASVMECRGKRLAASQRSGDGSATPLSLAHRRTKDKEHSQRRAAFQSDVTATALQDDKRYSDALKQKAPST